jgi:pimeloyl-ACP methyl ester carboxylesterase
MPLRPDPAPVREARLARPWYAPVSLLRRLLLILALGYFGLCLDLYFTQDRQIYPGALGLVVFPTDVAIQKAKEQGLVPWDHPTAGAASPQGYVPLHFTDPAPRGTIVVFHGNGNWAGQRWVYADAFHRRGFRTFLYEYPGYGGRPGAPHERLIVPDARALVRELDQEGLSPIYLWGESLGSGVAAAVAADPTLPIHGLVLLTPFDRIAGVALYRYPYIPVTLLLRDRYDTMDNLEHFQHPICVVRSEKDEIIPPALTLLLYAHLPEPKKMIVQKGVGHEDWPDAPDLGWWDEALNFIAPVSPAVK